MALALFVRRLAVLLGILMLTASSYAYWGSERSPLGHLAEPGALLLMVAAVGSAGVIIIRAVRRHARRRRMATA